MLAKANISIPLVTDKARNIVSKELHGNGYFRLMLKVDLRNHHKSSVNDYSEEITYIRYGVGKAHLVTGDILN